MLSYSGFKKRHCRFYFTFSVGKIQTIGTRCRSISDPNSITVLEPFKLEVDKLIKASVASNTLNMYNKGLENVNNFRIKHMPENSWPPKVDHIVNCVAFLSSKGLSYSTAKCYLAGVRFHLQISGFSDPTIIFVVRKMLEGPRRIKPSKDVRSPIAYPFLKRIVNVLQTICTNKYEYYLFSSAFLLAYFALLRVGEITVSNKNGPDRVLGIKDIEIKTSDTVKLRIRMSKTDQLGFGTNIEITPSEESFILNELLSEYFKGEAYFPWPFVLSLCW